jgi:hypothetical protein
MRTARWSLGILLLVPMGFASAQSEPPPQNPPAQATASSLGNAARQARDAKKDQAKPARVWDNDSVPKAGDQISVVGEKPGEAEGDAAVNAAPAENAAASGEAAGGVKSSHLADDVKNAKERLATIKVDLDILQRTYTLDAAMYYGKPDYSNDTDGAAKLKGEQDAIATKQQEMDEQQKKIDELEEALAKSAPEAKSESGKDESPK